MGAADVINHNLNLHNQQKKTFKILPQLPSKANKR